MLFLAAMSSSRSDDVTKCVRPCVVILLSLELSKHLKLDVSRVLQGCLNVLWVSQRCSKGVLRVFQECFKDVSKVFQKCL